MVLVSCPSIPFHIHSLIIKKQTVEPVNPDFLHNYHAFWIIFLHTVMINMSYQFGV